MIPNEETALWVEFMNYSLLRKLAGGLYFQYLFPTMKDIAMELCEDFFF